MSVVFRSKYGFKGVEKRQKRRLGVIGVGVKDEKEVRRFLERITTFRGVDCYRLVVKFKFIIDRISEEEEEKQNRVKEE